MAGFLYFVPGGGAPDLAQVREWGLGYAFDEGFPTRETSGGPGRAGSGYVFADRVRLGNHRLLLDEETQEWRKITTRAPDQREVWLGWHREDPPTPEALVRKKLIRGWEMPMGDGRKWHIPLVSRFDIESRQRVSALPSAYDLDPEGRLVSGPPLAAHQWLWDATAAAWDSMVAGEDVSDQSLLLTAGAILSANYYLHAMEAIVMKAFTPDQSPVGIVALAIDYLTWSGWNESQKKTESCSPTDG